MPSPGQLVLDRLASVSAFRPSTTESFTDWRLQAGDVVSVTSGNDSYQVPIFGMTLKWNGKPRASLESTGNQEREELPAMQRKSYATGARGYANSSAILGNIEGLSALDGKFNQLITGQLRASSLIAGAITASTLSVGPASIGNTTLTGSLTMTDYGGYLRINNERLVMDDYTVRWRVARVVTNSDHDVSAERLWKYQDSGGTEHTESGRIVKDFTIINYLGR